VEMTVGWRSLPAGRGVPSGAVPGPWGLKIPYDFNAPRKKSFLAR
jgi:hypothetical protein